VNFVTLRGTSLPGIALTQHTDPTRIAPPVQTYRPGQSAEVAVPASGRGPATELGGRKDGTEPTRFGDWEKQGRCIDF